jgi:hypothetical protein
MALSLSSHRLRATAPERRLRQSRRAAIRVPPHATSPNVAGSGTATTRDVASVKLPKLAGGPETHGQLAHGTIAAQGRPFLPAEHEDRDQDRKSVV